MTTTKELREALQSTEPAFTGFEVDGIRRQARRIRRRQRVAAAVLACSVATGGAAVLTRVEDAPLPRGAGDADFSPADSRLLSGLPAPLGPAGARELVSRPVRRRSGPLPPVNKNGQHVDVGLGANKAWMAPAIGDSAPQFCFGVLTTCDTVRRSDDGVLVLRSVKVHGREDVQLMVVEGPVAEAKAMNGDSAGVAVAFDLGFGYSVVVGYLGSSQPNPAEPVTQAMVAFDGTGQIVARYAVSISARGAVSTSASVRTGQELWPLPQVAHDGPAVRYGSNDSIAYLRRPGTSGTSGSVCFGLRAAAAADECTAIPTLGSPIVLHYAFTDASQTSVTAVVVTNAPITAVDATFLGDSTSGVVSDLGQGYRIARIATSSPPVSGEQDAIRIQGKDGTAHTLLEFTQTVPAA